MAVGTNTPKARHTDDNHEGVGWNFLNITGQATTVVKAASGMLHTITFNKPVATATIVIYDNASAASGTKLASITVPASPQPVTLTYDAFFANGITVVTGVADEDITITYI